MYSKDGAKETFRVTAKGKAEVQLKLKFEVRLKVPLMAHPYFNI